MLAFEKNFLWTDILQWTYYSFIFTSDNMTINY
ncbi:uncharacterized protein METZ01_LOCUS110679, partial [marine metagenome]